MDERETILRSENRRKQTENPLLQKNGRKGKHVVRKQKSEYKLLVLRIILVLLVILLIVAFILEFGQTEDVNKGTVPAQQTEQIQQIQET